MKEVTKPFKYSQSGKMGSVMILIVILVITIGAGIYNNILEKQNNEIEQSIAEHKKNIAELEGKKNIFIASLLKVHEQTLKEMDRKSQITKYMDHLQKMSEFYNFEARGFRMGGGKIESRVSFVNNEFGIAYKKAKNFISGYRNDQDALLELTFIQSIQSVDNEVKFPTSFLLK